MKEYLDVEDYIKREVWKFIYDCELSNPDTYYREAVFFIATNINYETNHSLNIFKKLIRENRWRTPFGMKNANWDFIASL